MSIDVEALYSNRFTDADRRWKEVVWRVLWRRVFSAYVDPGDVLVDVGAGYCEFINVARARRRIAVDLNPETRTLAASGVETHLTPADRMAFLADGEADVVFSSNFLEHMPDKAAVSRVLSECHRILKPGGRILLVGPNVRYLPGAYWDYFDHHVPLTERSVSEALVLAGFRVAHVEARFLPYTVKSRLPRWAWLVHVFLALRGVAGRAFGKQFLVVAVKR